MSSVVLESQPSVPVGDVALHPTTSAAAQSEPFIEMFRAAVFIALICALVVASFIMGIERRMDHKIGWGPLDDVWHLSIAISKDVYGLQGYVGFYKVFETLQHSLGIKDWNVGANQPEMSAMWNDRALNNAIERAASINELRGVGRGFPRTLEAYRDGLKNVVGSNLISPNGEDLGESDLYALAFRLFGLRIESAYYFFFLLFGASIVAYLVQFWRNPTALAVLLFNVCAFHVLFYLEFFQPFLPTVYFNRFASTMCIIPACHFLFLLIERRRITLFSLALALVQLAIFVFGLFVRASGNWEVMAAVVLTAGMLTVTIARTRRTPLMLRLCQSVKTVRVWPIVTLLGGVAALALYVNTVPNPIYRTDANQPHHMFWHSGFIGLSYHPDFSEYFPDLPRHSDATAQILSRRIWVARGHTSESFDSPITHAMRIGLHETIIREQFLKFVRAHPLYFLEAVFYYKPLEFYRIVKELALTVDRDAAIPVVAVLLMVGMLGIGRGTRTFSAPIGVGVAALLFVFSLGPILWAYPAPHVIADEAWALTALVLAVAAAILCGAIRLTQTAIQKAARSENSWQLTGARSWAGRAALPVATGVSVLALIWLLAWRAQLPGINILGVGYPDCATDDPDVGARYADEKVSYTYFAARECDGRPQCDFHSPRPYVGAPGVGANACKTQIQLFWMCGLNGRHNETPIGADPNDDYSAPIACR